MTRRKRVITLISRAYLLLFSLLALAALGSPAAAQSAASGQVAVPSGHGDVVVLYAGSLTNMMEHDLGAAFDKATGFRFVGEGKGSKALATEIKGKLRRADVFISASPSVDEALMGAANGDWLRWYASFAEAPVVIGYNPKSRIASQLTDASWPKVLSQPGLRLG
ncbi:MAG TPA: substrate-binding domain-containing protein, partial [Trueperaceae bacterium]|nr:substrate-binding domain-containing protein [Trueperaceae bacterium]